MIKPGELLRDVDFKQQFDVDSVVSNEQLGFMEVKAEDVAFNSLRILGFATPFARAGGFDRSDFVWPITKLGDLPPEAQTIDAQGKGVGPRLYNVREAFGGARERPDFVGIFTADIRRDHLLDLRASQGGKVAQVGRHAGRILRSKLGGLEAVVQDIHDSYAKVRNDGRKIDAVELEMPPLPGLRQVKHGVKNPVGITPAFMIIRNPDILLTKVGETDAPW